MTFLNIGHQLMIDEGYIKYQCHWFKDEPISLETLKELNQWRDQCYQLGLIGQYKNGIGFGNLSIRHLNPKQFIISGTQTGGLAHLTEEHYTIVTDYNWRENWLTCRGPIKASSEALTHAAIYEANPNIQGVIHIHHQELWNKLLNKVPTTDVKIAYGTPAMAQEIIRLCQQKDLQQQKILAMAGHEEGIITFGETLTQAGNILLSFVKNYL